MPSLRRSNLFAVVLSAALSGLAGCGNKGPLYLPDAEPTMPAPQTEPERAGERSGDTS